MTENEENVSLADLRPGDVYFKVIYASKYGQRIDPPIIVDILEFRVIKTGKRDLVAKIMNDGWGERRFRDYGEAVERKRKYGNITRIPDAYPEGKALNVLREKFTWDTRVRQVLSFLDKTPLQHHEFDRPLLEALEEWISRRGGEVS